MARIPLRDPDDPDIEPKAKAILENVRATADRFDIVTAGILNMHRLTANHAEVMEKLFALMATAYFENSLPTARLRELPYLVSAMANNCHY